MPALPNEASAPPGSAAPPVDLATWRPDWDYGPLAEFPVYTRANIGEVIPGIMSPLAASAGATALDVGFQIVGGCLGTWAPFRHQLPPAVERGEQAAFVGVFYGRAYLNLSLITTGADLVPGASAAAVEEQYLGGVRNPGAPPRTLTRTEQRIRLLVIPRGLRIAARLPRLTAEQGVRVDRFLEQEALVDPQWLSNEELLVRIDYTGRWQLPVAGLHLLNSTFASPGLETLTKSVRAWLPDAPAGMVERLVTGLPDVESAKPAYGLWRLSRLALASPALRDLFAHTDAGELADALAAQTGADADAFRSECAAFLREYGYRAMREAELSSRSWAEDPTFVYATIKSYMQAGEDADPVAAHDRQARLRQEAERYADEHLGLVRRAVFRKQVGFAQRFIALREKTKAQWVRAMGPTRALVREGARRLVAAGLLAQADDVYLLLNTEFAAALRGELDAAAVGVIVARRREAIAICEQIELPEWFEGRPTARWIGAEADASPAEAASPASAAEEAVLRGIAVSPGRVRGRARVITTLDEDAAVEQGEILVAPFTDAAWTPLFFTAAAVVVDLGGPLSHGSTVAREYGLPAVVNVKTGTRRIRDGQEITVDGTRGEVILHA